jgi:16S rRNA (adenine1518-N6/adenine1519-N6)-dimethyltransferase
MVVRKKSFGQHFLHDRKVMHDTARALEWRDGEQVVEIGPGTGRLTRVLIDHIPVTSITAIELDPEMIGHLAEQMPELTVRSADAARIDWGTVVGDGPAVLVGNLPYNASAPILFNALAHRHRFRRFVFMFQRELALRLAAKPGSGDYGPPSAIVRLLAPARYLFTVRPSAFRPPPKVDSAVLAFDPLPAPALGVAEAEVQPLSKFIHGAFQQRRKTLRNNLRAMALDTEPILAAVGLEGRERPEELDLETFVALWRASLHHTLVTAPPAC